MARNEDVRRHSSQSLQGGRPVREIPVEHGRHDAIEEHVATEENLRIGHQDVDVPVGVGAAEIEELDQPVAQVDGQALAEAAGGVGGWNEPPQTLGIFT